MWRRAKRSLANLVGSGTSALFAPDLDDTQRNIAGGIGVALMGAAIAWVVALTIPSAKQSWELRGLVPLIMFMAGAAIVVWAWRGRADRPGRLLDRAIGDGRALLRHMSRGLLWPALIKQWQQWQDETFAMLQRRFDLATAQDFQTAGITGSHPSARVATQVAYLEELKKR